ncbi:LOW QUALITY PROTEIN: facilitated trehalose transporter Tret1 [Drosophila eugracilis]|uniref:LOW QUALITY PROTEIN: facilitated trehalose transporter Tret1 n=1 Tax=Drosophila eugracilis TaxID=29029 RepID=UPI0007E7F2FC|nr:LOW QUALITY PROTEIN: facilitated trehalose transporter Tret1 [Drosophila eugracilis]
MLLNIFQSGIFQPQFRRQLLVSLSATLITFCHGIALGWLSPMLPKLMSSEETPLPFWIDVAEASWLGAVISIGGISGNFSFSYIMNRFGRKVSIYALAVPHTCIWFLFYFAQSIEWLYVARVCAGLTGGGMFVVLPIFIGEIADNSIRGRLCSFFTLTMNTGIMVGFVVSSHIAYHVIPCAVVGLPVLYVILATRYPEPPQQLIRWQREEEAERSLRFYRRCDGPNVPKEEERAYQKQFDEMRVAIQQQHKDTDDNSLALSDFLTKRSLKALATGLVLMIANIFTGTFAFINYMSNIFDAVHTQLDPNTSTIIIGAVQILGTLASIYLVDRHGRRILLIISCAGSGIGTSAFGLYAFFAEEQEEELAAFSAWLPVTLMAFIIFIANVGVISVTMVVLVEILPQRIRAVATSFCLGCLSFFAFTSLKTFPLMMFHLGLAATMWFCGAVSAICLFYVVVCLEETKGRSMYD